MRKNNEDVSYVIKLLTGKLGCRKIAHHNDPELVSAVLYELKNSLNSGRLSTTCRCIRYFRHPDIVILVGSHLSQKLSDDLDFLRDFTKESSFVIIFYELLRAAKNPHNLPFIKEIIDRRIDHLKKNSTRHAMSRFLKKIEKTSGVHYALLEDILPSQ
jgi:hypothetical protein